MDSHLRRHDSDGTVLTTADGSEPRGVVFTLTLTLSRQGRGEYMIPLDLISESGDNELIAFYVKL